MRRWETCWERTRCRGWRWETNTLQHMWKFPITALIRCVINQALQYRSWCVWLMHTSAWYLHPQNSTEKLHQFLWNLNASNRIWSFKEFCILHTLWGTAYYIFFWIWLSCDNAFSYKLEYSSFISVVTSDHIYLIWYSLIQILVQIFLPSQCWQTLLYIKTTTYRSIQNLGIFKKMFLCII